MLKLIQRITYLVIIGSVVALCVIFIIGLCLGLNPINPSGETADLLTASLFVGAMTFLASIFALAIENFIEVEMRYRYASQITKGEVIRIKRIENFNSKWGQKTIELWLTVENFDPARWKGLETVTRTIRVSPNTNVEIGQVAFQLDRLSQVDDLLLWEAVRG